MNEIKKIEPYLALYTGNRKSNAEYSTIWTHSFKPNFNETKQKIKNQNQIHHNVTEHKQEWLNETKIAESSKLARKKKE